MISRKETYSLPLLTNRYWLNRRARWLGLSLLLAGLFAAGWGMGYQTATHRNVAKTVAMRASWQAALLEAEQGRAAMERAAGLLLKDRNQARAALLPRQKEGGK